MGKVTVNIPWEPRARPRSRQRSEPFHPPPFRRKDMVPCPCCTGPAADAREEDWYFDRNLIRVASAGPYDPEPAGTIVWQCRICQNRRKVTPAKAMTFILTTL